MNEKQQLSLLNKRIEYGNIIYSLNEKDSTASVIGCLSNTHNVFIPRSINFKSKEYIVTSILEYAFDNKSKIDLFQFASDSNLQIIGNSAFCFSTIKSITIPSTVTSIGENAFCQCLQLKTIEIPNDSKLKTIHKEAFMNSVFESITFPSDLIELKEGWCYGMNKVTKINISPKNPKYSCYKDKLIIGKTTIEQENYDCLVFCVRNVQNITIPSFIEHICPYSFADCRQLQTIEIPNDSKLKTIDKNAFEESPIESLTIPSELIELKEGWCCNMSKITKVNVSPKNTRYCCFDEKMIIGKTTIEQENYDCLVFCVRNVQSITIPSFITHICSYSFSNCEQLKTIEIPDDSKLQTIGNYVFHNLSIESITIPSTVTSIGEGAFIDCKNLRQIEIPNDSKLQVLDQFVFSRTSIESITIPSQLIELKKGWCSALSNITKINVSPKNPRYRCYKDELIIGKTTIEQENYDCIIFCVRNIQNITIPSFIEHICPYSFVDCMQLQTIEIPIDSKLKTIDKNAIFESSIESISIPSTVTSIGEGAFYECSNLIRIKIPINSKLQAINNSTFYHSSIRIITIPSSVEIIGKNAFIFCDKLQRVEISSDSKLQVIDNNAFQWSSIQSIAIPSSVIIIGEYAFSACNQLKKVEIPIDSKLQVIEKYSFFGTSIHSITIPSSVTIIGKNALNNCRNLCIMEIFNVELMLMFPMSFIQCEKAIFMIPVRSQSFY